MPMSRTGSSPRSGAPPFPVPGQWPEVPPGLTPTQRRLLPVLATEKNYFAIGKELSLDPENVKGQAGRIPAKRGAHTRHGALVRWLRPDLVP